MKTAKEIECEIVNLDNMPYDPIRQTQIEMLNEMLKYANKLESLSLPQQSAPLDVQEIRDKFSR